MFAKTVGCLDDIQELKSFSGCIPWLVDEVHVCLAVGMKLFSPSRVCLWSLVDKSKLPTSSFSSLLLTWISGLKANVSMVALPTTMEVQ